jgi:uncharacterized protein (DUF1800 family)
MIAGGAKDREFMSLETAIAFNRFGLGARPDDNVTGKAANLLRGQLARFEARPATLAGQPGRSEIAATYQQYRMDRRERRQEKRAEAEAMKPDDAMSMVGAGAPASEQQQEKLRNELRQTYAGAVEARLATALASDAGFAERLVHFWSNHFAVSIDKQTAIGFAGDFEFNAIRPNIMGKFSELLVSATTHPAMLLYLDQAQSIGPNSPLATRVAERRNKELGLNENLAREILELHTLGVRSVYTQADVTEFARALTGYTVGGIARGPMQRALQQNGNEGDTQFFAGIHEPGSRTLLGKSYAQNGKMQAGNMLMDLAVHPATAKHIATKLARHFVADTPPPTLVAKLEKAFLQSGGDLPAVYGALIDAPEAWAPQQAKFKSPWDWVVSSQRALNARELPGNNRQSVQLFNQLGQPIWRPGSPAGYADTTENWAGGAALMRRVEIAGRLAQRNANRVDARTLAPLVLPGQLSKTTTESIARAESPSQGLALMLLSPEFLRR